MTTPLKRAIVRILNSSGETVGGGFVLTDDGLIATCAHVVVDTGSGPGKNVNFIFRFSGDEATAMVEPDGWRDPDTEDIAILQANTPLPEGVKPLPLGQSTNTRRHHFETFGFPDANPVGGLSASGHILGRTILNGVSVLQLRSQEVTGGFSGAPVFDAVNQQVIGMVTSTADPDSRGRLSQTAFMTPLEKIATLCPALVLQPPPDPYTQKLKDYRDYIKKQTQDVTMKGVPLPPEVGKVPLDKIYIQLQAVEHKIVERQRKMEQLEREEAACAESKKEKPKRRETSQQRESEATSHIDLFILKQFGEQFYRQGSTYRTDERPEPISPADALKEHNRLVILGAPGSGKSTLLRWLARQAAFQDDGPIPILVSARDFSTDSAGNLFEFALKEIGKEPHLVDAVLIDTLTEADKQGNVLWLIDALDEARGEHRLDVVSQVNNLLGQVVVASRPVEYSKSFDKERFKTFEVLPLVTENIDKFIADWFALLTGANPSQQAQLEERRQWLEDELKKPRLTPLMKNPLLLTFLVILASEEKQQTLPENRSELYQKYVDYIVENWEHYREGKEREEEERILAIRYPRIGKLLLGEPAIKAVKQGFIYLGWQLHLLYYGSETNPEPEKEYLINALANYLSRYYPEFIGDHDPIIVAEAIINFWLEAGLLDIWETNNKTYFTFRHLTFQEYAVAKYLHQKWQFNSDDTWQQIKPHLYHNVWREPLLLLAGLMEEEPLQNFINRLLQASKPFKHPEDFFEAHRFIGAILVFPIALILFPIALIIVPLLLLLVAIALVVKLFQRDKSKSQTHFSNRYIYGFHQIVNNTTNDINAWKKEWEELFSSYERPNVWLRLFQLKCVLRLLLTPAFWVLGIIPVMLSFGLAWVLSKGFINKIINGYRHLVWSNEKSLKKAVLAATQHEILLATELIGESPIKTGTETPKLVAQHLANLMRSDIPLLARAAAEAAAGVSEGPAGSIMLGTLIQDIYRGHYFGGIDDEHTPIGMPISWRVLLQQAKQKRMSPDAAQALLSRTLSDVKHLWIIEILSYYYIDTSPPDEFIQIVSNLMERFRFEKDDSTVHLAQCLVRWKHTTPFALAVLASKIEKNLQKNYLIPLPPVSKRVKYQGILLNGSFGVLFGLEKKKVSRQCSLLFGGPINLIQMLPKLPFSFSSP